MGLDEFRVLADAHAVLRQRGKGIWLPRDDTTPERLRALSGLDCRNEKDDTRALPCVEDVRVCCFCTANVGRNYARFKFGNTGK